MILLAILLAPVAAALLLILPKLYGKTVGLKAAWIVSSVVLFLDVLLVLAAGLGTAGDVLETYAVSPPGFDLSGFPLDFNLYMDDLSFLFALFVSGMPLLSSVFSQKYLIGEKKDHDVEMYFAMLLLFEAMMMGVVLSENIVTLLFFFEAMNVPTFFLCYYWGDPEAPGEAPGGKRAAVKYLVYMAVGASILVPTIGYLVFSTGQGSLLSLTSAQTSAVQGTSLMALGLFIGFGIKLGIFPFHNWLPDFHGEAPVPIHALLSGIMIKMGAYGWLRVLLPLFPSFFTQWQFPLALLALVSVGYSGYMAFSEPFLKRILAFSSASQVGYILLGMATLSTVGLSGGILHVFTHGATKGALLLVAGSIIAMTHRRKVADLAGLASRQPITAAVGLIGALSVAGTPPLAGFQSEWRIFLGGMESGMFLITLVGILLTVVTAAYYLMTIRRVFFGETPEELEHAKESPISMSGVLLVAAAIVVILGILPGLLTAYTEPIATALLEGVA